MTDMTGENSGNCKNGKSDEGGKGGKLQPKLRFKGFTDAWEQRALGELIPHKRVTVNPVSGTYYRLWSIPSYDAGNPELVDGNQIKSTKQIVQNNDVLLGKINPRINRVWVVAIQPLDLAINIASTEWIIFRSTTNNSFDPYFILSFLSAPNTRTRLMSEVTGATGSQKRFQPASIAQHPYYTSSLPEQECIGSLFRCLDSLIAAAERKVLLLKKKKQAYLNHIFTQHLRFTGHTTPWQTKKLGELEREQKIRLGRGKVISENDITSTPGKYPIYSSSARNNGEMGRYGLWMFNQELVTWSIDGGGSVFYRPKHRFSITNVCGFVQVLTNIDCPFLAYQMMYIHNKIHFDYTVKAHPSVIRKLYFLGVPSIEEQIKIGNFFQTLDSLITATERKVSLLKKKKQAYLQRMFI